MEAVVFALCAAIIMGGALGVILFTNPVHAALSLVATLFGVAVIFINLEAYFLAAVQVIVYAGAIVVVFLFVIMLLGVDRAENVQAEPIVGQRSLALLAGAGMVAIAILVGISVGGNATGQKVSPSGIPGDADIAIQDILIEGPAINDAGGALVDPETGELETEVVAEGDSNVKQLARVLFTDYVFAFEITAILLTIAVVGAVVLARKPRGELQDLPEMDLPVNYRPERLLVGASAEARAEILGSDDPDDPDGGADDESDTSDNAAEEDA